MTKIVTHENALNLIHLKKHVLSYLAIYCIFKKFGNIQIIFKRRALSIPYAVAGTTALQDNCTKNIQQKVIGPDLSNYPGMFDTARLQSKY